MAIRRPNDVLEVTAGSTSPWTVEMADDRDQPEDLSLVDAATLRVAKFVGASLAGDVVIDRSILAGNLSKHTGTNVDTDPSWFRATLSQAEADALPPGVYVGAIAARFGSADTWQDAIEFTVRINPKTAPRTGP